MKHIYCIMGESGCGKDTVVAELCRRHNLKELRSYTTRKPRFKGENTHIFVSGLTDEQIHQQYPDIAAETVFDGHMYWCTQSQLNDADIYIIDPAGVKSLKERYKGKRKVRVIYLHATGVTRRLRMSHRGDTPMQIEERIAHDKKAFAEAEDLADIKIWNDALATTVAEVWEYIESEEKKKK